MFAQDGVRETHASSASYSIMLVTQHDVGIFH
jgi:hypothetical protein